jgi:hypothetical protein
MSLPMRWALSTTIWSAGRTMPAEAGQGQQSSFGGFGIGSLTQN